MVCADGVSRSSRASRSSVGRRRRSTSAKRSVRGPPRVETPHEPCAAIRSNTRPNCRLVGLSPPFASPLISSQSPYYTVGGSERTLSTNRYYVPSRPHPPPYVCLRGQGPPRRAVRQDDPSCLCSGLIALCLHILPDSNYESVDKKPVSEAAVGSLTYTCWVLYANQATAVRPDEVFFQSHDDDDDDASSANRSVDQPRE